MQTYKLIVGGIPLIAENTARGMNRSANRLSWEVIMTSDEAWKSTRLLLMLLLVRNFIVERVGVDDSSTDRLGNAASLLEMGSPWFDPRSGYSFFFLQNEQSSARPSARLPARCWATTNPAGIRYQIRLNLLCDGWRPRNPGCASRTKNIFAVSKGNFENEAAHLRTRTYSGQHLYCTCQPAKILTGVWYWVTVFERYS